VSRVALVGAGPGDPGLITVRGLELLNSAEVVVTDFLIDSRLKQRIAPHVQIVDVGKRPGQASFSQEAINQELVSLAREHDLVVRLKGGDPFLFGRGGEEVDALLQAGISVEVVPGVSSAIAGPAFAGIPVTHRGLADGFLVITGHRHADAPLDYDWSALVASGLTIVVLMGVAHRRYIATSLINAGMDPTTPVAVIESVTWPQEQSLRTTLAQVGDVAVSSPAVIIVGKTAGLELAWRGSSPLAGLSVALLRPFDPGDALARRLRDLGAMVVEAPAIELREPSDGGAALRTAMEQVERYDWLVFTSKNGVQRTLNHCGDLRRLARVKIACIGSGTQAALAGYRIGCDLVPQEFVGESLVAAFPAGTGRVLFPRARVARDVVVDGLRSKGWSVDLVEAYQVAIPDPVMTHEQAKGIDIVIFTSASTVDGFSQQYPGVLPQHAVAIGPVTAKCLQSIGVTQPHVAQEFSAHGLLELVMKLVARRATS
jgi:uroporphyrinogen III methyltransferase/synthase